MHQLFFAFSTFQFSIINVLCNSSPIIRQTLNGPVEGIEQTSLLDQKYYAFRGIPFAEPPITGKDPYTGEQVDRRFKVRKMIIDIFVQISIQYKTIKNLYIYFQAPEPLNRKWTETLKVHDFADSCMSAEVPNPNSLNQTFSENCLYLNVYVPGTE